MTEAQCRTIAEAAIRVRDLTADLRESESRGNFLSSREQRRSLAAAQAALDQAIADAVER